MLLRQVMRTLAAIVLGPRLHVEGADNVPRRGGVLVVGNHIATVDPPLSGSLIRRLDVYYMAKAESFRSARTRWLFYGYHAFPVVRGSADRSALRRAISLLKQGHVLLVYPEGSRSPDATMQRPHAGVGFLLRQTGVQVLPVAIWGSERVLPKGSTWPHRDDVYIRFGKSFIVPETDADGHRFTHQETADQMMWRVAEMLPPEYRGVFTSAESVASASPSAA